MREDKKKEMKMTDDKGSHLASSMPVLSYSLILPQLYTFNIIIVALNLTDTAKKGKKIVLTVDIHIITNLCIL